MILPGKARQAPLDLQMLLDDHRSSPPRHHLRQLYVDPMTGQRDWVTVPGLGGVIRVHSASADKPLKVAGFPVIYKSFDGATAYSSWIFVSNYGDDCPSVQRRRPPAPPRFMNGGHFHLDGFFE